jgi:L-alanine-DL-glutamate epimerase-like enolase superfamily enzyme
MKIVQVESFLLARQYIIVRVTTDEGIVGYGECSPMNGPAIKSMVDNALTPLIIGADPFDVEALRKLMLTRCYKLGPMGALNNAIAGIDIALWDIIGKAVGQPVYRMIGGEVRKKVELYASFMRRDLTPVEEAKRAAHFVEQGFRAIKIHSATPWMYDTGFDQTLKTVKEIRAAVGDDIMLMVDPNNAYTPHRAIQIGRQLEEFGVFHFEEPVAAYDYPGLAEVAQALDIPIAAGEQEYTVWQFRALITEGKVDILQPDVVKSGGITETKKIIQLGEAFNKPVTMHQTQPTIGQIATVHLAAASPMCLYPQEYNIEPHPLRERLLTSPLEIKDGFIEVPDKPGLGIEIDEKALKELMKL